MPGMLGLYDELEKGNVLDEATRSEVFNEVIDQINHEFSSNVLQNPSELDRQRICERVNAQIAVALRKRNCRPGAQQEAGIAEELTRRILGLGFLDLLLPPARTDISEITIYSSGLVQLMRKGSVRWETIDLHPEAGEIWRVLDRLIGPQNKTLNETNPSINAKLPATPDNPGGGRIKALHPVIAPPGRNPSINIRLYEQKPVTPEWLLERGLMNPEMMDLLRQAMEGGKRILISGGTRTGKTTLLSALCNFLPSIWRIVKIEDPEEIWVDRPTIQTIEARPQAIGTDVRPYTLADGVDDAMRMSPDYLVIGEVRDGIAAMSLFRALMTGHSGACTFHADSPREAARRLATVMGADAGVKPHEANQMICDAVDLLVQIGIRHEVRRVIAISNVSKDLKNGDVFFEPRYLYMEDSSKIEPRWKKIDILV
ncbi:MAG: Flp pilus assembly complex ATPase component TadA [Chloroflexi bacterium]|nr:Flp pilus assembly complex ATPase component TadA [Chloroflexota bacterium]